MDAFRHDLARGKFVVKMPPLSEWRDARVRGDEKSGFQLQMEGEIDIWTDWDEWREIDGKVQLPAETKGMEGLESLVRATSTEAVRLATFFLRTSRGGNMIAMPKLSRSGGGADTHVPRATHAAFRFLQQMAALYPAALCPAPVQKRQGVVIGFTILHYPLLLHLRERIEHVLLHADGGSMRDVDMLEEQKATVFAHLRRPENRPIWAHQRMALQAMREQKAMGRRGYPIWLRTGSGKTSLPLEHLADEPDVDTLVYVVNMESFTNVLTQLKEFGQPPERIKIVVPIRDVPAKMKKTQAFVPHLWSWASHHDEHGQMTFPPGAGHVLLVTHDHLKHPAMGTLDAIVTKSAIVMDEAHLVMAPSQRTHAALSFCSRAPVFFALTGTPTLDSSLTGMADWFSLMVGVCRPHCPCSSFV